MLNTFLSNRSSYRFTLGMCTCKGPRKCSFKIGAIWKHDMFDIKTNLINPATSARTNCSLCSSGGADPGSVDWGQQSLLFLLQFITFTVFEKKLQPALPQAKQTAHYIQAGLERSLHYITEHFAHHLTCSYMGNKEWDKNSNQDGGGGGGGGHESYKPQTTITNHLKHCRPPSEHIKSFPETLCSCCSSCCTVHCSSYRDSQESTFYVYLRFFKCSPTA